MQQAFGHLPWPPETVLKSDVNLLHIAIEGRIDVLQSIFGGKPPPGKGKRMSAEQWKARFNQHNALMSAKQRIEKKRGAHG